MGRVQHLGRGAGGLAGAAAARGSLRRRMMWRALGLAIALAAGFAIFYLDAVTPRPASASAPPDRFSAGRAMADVRAMAPRRTRWARPPTPGSGTI